MTADLIRLALDLESGLKKLEAEGENLKQEVTEAINANKLMEDEQK
jgi:hypothetical protein